MYADDWYLFGSAQREPLGKSMLRGHKIPEAVAEDGFGKKVHAQVGCLGVSPA